jgi:hypothetical protein
MALLSQLFLIKMTLFYLRALLEAKNEDGFASARGPVTHAV